MSTFLERAWFNVLSVLNVRAIPPGPPLTWDYFMRDVANSATGIAVNEHTALNHSPVWSGVSTLSRDVAKLPLVLYKNLPNGGKKRFTEHKLYRILHDEPNPEMTSFKFRETMQALCLLYGNAYAEIVRDSLGRPAGLYPIVPTRVTPIREERSGQLLYRVNQPSGGQALVSPRNMLHLTSLSTDGIIGHSIVEHAKESIGLGLATEKFGATFFGNGATFGGVAETPLTFDGPKGKDLQNNIRSAIEAVHAGVDRAHKILVLGGGTKFTQRGTAPNEAQFIETRKFQINEVARWLSMPPHKLGDLENAHFTNIEEQEIQYYVGCVSGWLKMWEQELARKLILPLEYTQQTIEHNLEGVLRGDSTKRADFYTRMFQIGAFSINRILELENQNPIGPSGDVHMVPLNMMPVEKYGEYIDATIKKMAAPPPQPVLPKPKDDDEDADKAAAQRQLEQAEQARRAAEATRDEALALAREKDALALEARHAQEAETRARAEAETRAGTADASRAESDARAEMAAEKSRVAVLEAEAASAAAVAAEIALEAARQERDAKAAEAAELSAALATRKQSELDRLTRVVTAHRALIADIVRRMLGREIDRANRVKSEPAAVKRWADGYYQTHLDVCTDALVPAVQTHLAWKGSDDDPEELARTLATAHCERSRRDLQAVIDGAAPEDFHETLKRTLARWEQDRPNQLADEVLRDEIAYIRSYQ